MSVGCFRRIGWRSFEYDSTDIASTGLQHAAMRSKPIIHSRVTRPSRTPLNTTDAMLFYRHKFNHPKRRFWKEEQKMTSRFSKHFSRARVLDLGYEQLKSQSKIRMSSFVPPSKIFVWELQLDTVDNGTHKLQQSSCYHRLFMSTCISSCYRHFEMSKDTRHSVSYMHIVMPSSSFDDYRHIPCGKQRLRKCGFPHGTHRHVIIMGCRQTPRMHALLTRPACTSF
jgi:hypothetical protein